MLSTLTHSTPSGTIALLADVRTLKSRVFLHSALSADHVLVNVTPLMVFVSHHRVSLWGCCAQCGPSWKAGELARLVEILGSPMEREVLEWEVCSRCLDLRFPELSLPEGYSRSLDCRALCFPPAK